MTNYRHVSPDIMAAALKGDGEVNDIEQKALALVNEVARELGWGEIKEIFAAGYTRNEALFRAIEQHEAFRQEVSDAVGDTLFMVETHCDGEALALVSNRLLKFIIPKAKPDPLVEAMTAAFGEGYEQLEADNLRAMLDKLGFEIREINT